MSWRVEEMCLLVWASRPVGAGAKASLEAGLVEQLLGRQAGAAERVRVEELPEAGLQVEVWRLIRSGPRTEVVAMRVEEWRLAVLGRAVSEQVLTGQLQELSVARLSAREQRWVWVQQRSLAPLAERRPVDQELLMQEAVRQAASAQWLAEWKTDQAGGLIGQLRKGDRR